MVKARGGWECVDDDEQYQYAGADGEASVAAALAQRDLIAAEGPDRQRATDLAMALYPVLARMQARGMAFDRQENLRLEQVYDQHLSDLRRQIQEHIGPINPASPDALAKAPHVVQLAQRAFVELGRACRLGAIRGGTVGAMFSEMGLPTPNLSVGQHNIAASPTSTNG